MIPDDAGFKTGGWDMNKYRQHARDDDIAMRNAEERTYQVIPDEAVEAAVGAYVGGNEVTGPDIAGDFLTREQLRTILEAAAPHISAQALEDAAKLAEIGEGGGADSGECEDWSAWLRSRANTKEEGK